MTEPSLGDMESEASLVGQTYDYIVVGGGTAGLVVASRLTEDPHVRVLVIETGADRRSDPRIYIPGLAVQTFDDPDFDWGFLTTPQVTRNRLYDRFGRYRLTISRKAWTAGNYINQRGKASEALPLST